MPCRYVGSHAYQHAEGHQHVACGVCMEGVQDVDYGHVHQHPGDDGMQGTACTRICSSLYPVCLHAQGVGM